jgi:hypothetical protein
MSPAVVKHQNRIGLMVWKVCALWYICELCITLLYRYVDLATRDFAFHAVSVLCVGFFIARDLDVESNERMSGKWRNRPYSISILA